jgi:hypothetical protein
LRLQNTQLFQWKAQGTGILVQHLSEAEMPVILQWKKTTIKRIRKDPKLNGASEWI